MHQRFKRRLFWYQITTVFSVVFALAGFSYNVWRMEISERNDTMRTASFEMLKQMAEIEQLLYLSVYDGDTTAGNPRKIWAKIGLIVDLSKLTPKPVALSCQALKQSWSDNWQHLAEKPQALNDVIQAIDQSRAKIRMLLSDLE